jgi:hypothetical protein
MLSLNLKSACRRFLCRSPWFLTISYFFLHHAHCLFSMFPVVCIFNDHGDFQERRFHMWESPVDGYRQPRVTYRFHLQGNMAVSLCCFCLRGPDSVSSFPSIDLHVWTHLIPHPTYFDPEAWGSILPINISRSTCKTMCRHNPEGHDLNSHCLENLRTYMR